MQLMQDVQSLKDSPTKPNFKNSLKSYKSSDLFNFGERETSIKLAQLRMKCSKLNAHLFDIHVIESAACSCGFDIEDTNHYLFHCLLFSDERRILFDMLHNLNITNITEEILLQGCTDNSLEENQQIFSCMFSFIEATKRL